MIAVATAKTVSVSLTTAPALAATYGMLVTLRRLTLLVQFGVEDSWFRVVTLRQLVQPLAHVRVCVRSPSRFASCSCGVPQHALTRVQVSAIVQEQHSRQRLGQRPPADTNIKEDFPLLVSIGLFRSVIA